MQPRGFIWSFACMYAVLALIVYIGLRTECAILSLATNGSSVKLRKTRQIRDLNIIVPWRSEFLLQDLSNPPPIHDSPEYMLGKRLFRFLVKSFKSRRSSTISEDNPGSDTEISNAKNVTNLDEQTWWSVVILQVEMGSKNHEVVPMTLITQLASLRHGGVHKIIKDLAKRSLVSFEKNSKCTNYTSITNLTRRRSPVDVWRIRLPRTQSTSQKGCRCVRR